MEPRKDSNCMRELCVGQSSQRTAACIVRSLQTPLDLTCLPDSPLDKNNQYLYQDDAHEQGMLVALSATAPDELLGGVPVLY